MAIIIDTNCISKVFSSKETDHIQFKPIKDWIIKKNGIIIYGGTKYINELQKMHQYIRIFRILKDCKKIIEGNTQNIDNYQKYKVEALNSDPDFDDPHLPAIAVITKCILICSIDNRSIPHVTNRKYYPKGHDIPKYYTGLHNKNLLKNNYIHKTLKPYCIFLNKKQQKQFI